MIGTNTHLKRILVPVDLSPQSEQALPFAERLADADTELHLLHVHRPFDALGHPGAKVPPMLPSSDSNPQELQSKLDRIAVAHQGAEGDVKRVVVEGTPAPAILDYAKRNNVDLIVMTTHGSTGLNRMMMGSVAEQVVRHADCPVMTLRTGEANESAQQQWT